MSNRAMEPLICGDAVQIQNQKGNRPLKWYATGVVVECLANRQYSVLVDGSRRVTLRNRKFLRKIDPVCRKQRYAPDIVGAKENRNAAEQPLVTHAPRTPVALDMAPSTPATEGGIPPAIERVTIREHSHPPAECMDPGSATPQRPREVAPRIPRRIVAEPHEDNEQTDDALPRRSGRQRTVPVPFSPKLYGKSHR